MSSVSAFAEEALAFLSANCPRRPPQTVEWGVGPENLTIFHETTGESERHEAKLAKEWQAARWDAGFGWITGPLSYGGRGLDPSFDRLYRDIEEDFAVPDIGPLRVGLSTVSPSIVANGGDALIRQFALPIQQGVIVACQLFSEPDAGSDLAGVKTRAVRDGSLWRISGQKVWTSNAAIADVGLALVRTDPAAPKHAGLTAFLVPLDTRGVVVRPLRQMTGGASFAEVFFEDALVSDDLRLGDVGGGWGVATSTLATERTSTGDRSHAMTGRALALLQTLARREHRDDAVVRQQLADVAIRLQVARHYQLRMQSLPDDGRPAAARTLDKLMLADNLRRLGELACTLLGPRILADTGEWGTFGWSRWVLGATGYRIGGGTDEVLRNMVAERVLGLPREPAPRGPVPQGAERQPAAPREPR